MHGPFQTMDHYVNSDVYKQAFINVMEKLAKTDVPGTVFQLFDFVHILCEWSLEKKYGSNYLEY